MNDPTRTSLARSSSSSITTSTTTPYQGYNTLVSTSSLKPALERILTNLSKSTTATPDILSLKDETSELLIYINNRELIPSHKAVLVSAVASYIEEISTRTTSTSKSTSEVRFNQISKMLYALTSPAIDNQPSSVLLSQFDEVLASVNDNNNNLWIIQKLFASDLKRIIAPKVEKLWIPVLTDTKALLFKIGSALITLGASLIAGKIAMLYPITLVAKEAVNIVYKIVPNESDNRVRITVSDTLRLAKAAGLLYACSLLLSVISLSLFYGGLCVSSGVFLLSARSSDSFCKLVSAPIATVGTPILEMSTQIKGIIESQSGGAGTTSASAVSASSKQWFEHIDRNGS